MADLSEASHEALEAVAELLRVEEAEEAAERVMARGAVLELEKAARKFQLGSREVRHVGAVLPATQHGAERNHKHLQQVMLLGVTSTWIL